jgi:acetyl esterase
MGLPPRLQRLAAGRPIVLDEQELERETQLLLRLLKLTGLEEIGFTSDDRAGVEADSVLLGGRHPIGAVRDLEVPGANGALGARLYVPQALVSGRGDDPLLVFFHGGGWVVGSLESHDAPCRVLAERAGVRVLSVAYRLAPEHPFPAAPHDCIAAYRWVVDHAAELGASPDRLAVGGDSAGGNLAAVTAIDAAQAGLPLRFQLLVYPATDMTGAHKSRELFASGFILTAGSMAQAESAYLGEHDRQDPLVSPLFADIPPRLAPAYIATAGFDPLRDEGEAYGQRLTEAGVETTVRRFPGHIHSFFNAVGAGEAAPAAVHEIAAALGAALAD